MIKRNICGSNQKQLEIVLGRKLRELREKQRKAIECGDWKSVDWFAEDIRYYSKKLHNVKNGFRIKDSLVSCETNTKRSEI